MATLFLASCLSSSLSLSWTIGLVSPSQGLLASIAPFQGLPGYLAMIPTHPSPLPASFAKGGRYFSALASTARRSERGQVRVRVASAIERAREQFIKPQGSIVFLPLLLPPAQSALRLCPPSAFLFHHQHRHRHRASSRRPCLASRPACHLRLVRCAGRCLLSLCPPHSLPLLPLNLHPSIHALFSPHPTPRSEPTHPRRFCSRRVRLCVCVRLRVERAVCLAFWDLIIISFFNSFTHSVISLIGDKRSKPASNRATALASSLAHPHSFILARSLL